MYSVEYLAMYITLRSSDPTIQRPFPGIDVTPSPRSFAKPQSTMSTHIALCVGYVPGTYDIIKSPPNN